MLDRLRNSIARLIAPKGRTAVRMYSSARPSRLTAGWQASSTSEDAELSQSLRMLRDRSRALCRDASYAKRARTIVVNNVVGAGIGMQAKVVSTRGTNFERINAAIEDAWTEWSRADSCHTGGAMAFADLERAAMAQVFEAGEVFIRLHFAPFGTSRVPLALELIESERIVDDFQVAGPSNATGEYRMGIEVDAFGRAVAYHVRDRHPSEIYHRVGTADRITRVPADQILHLRVVDRWPQTRGVPWMHSVIRKLNDLDGYSEAEIVAARAAANYMGVIESDAADSAFGEEQADGTTQMELAPGIVERLQPGEKFDFVSPNRPNANAEAFIRHLLREIAAGIGVSYESLSRDYSQSNYSSSRLALLDDRDLWRVLQGWFLRSFREPLHRIWLQQAVLAGAIPAVGVAEYAASPAKFESVRFRPRGWGWVDPTKEVEAYKEALKAGFTTRADIIAQTGAGLDIEEVDEQREKELDDQEARGLVYDTDPEIYAAPPGNQAAAAPPEPEDDPEPADDDEQPEPSARVVSLRR